MNRLVLALAAGALLLAGYAAQSAVHPLFSDPNSRPLTPSSLRAAWKGVEGSYGVLKDDPRGPVLAVDLRDNRNGGVLVESVGSDCVVLGGDSNAPGWHTVYPLDRIELQILK